MDIFKRVTSVISDRLGIPEEEIKEHSLFKADLGADSLDVVELVMELEDTFEIEIPDDQAENIQTVGDAVRFIENNL